MIEYVSYKRWDNYAKRIEAAYLRDFGTSLSWSSIAAGANRTIVEIRSDSQCIVVDGDWKSEMKRKAHEWQATYRMPLTI